MKTKVLVAALTGLLIAPAWGQESDDLNFASGLEEFRQIRAVLPSYLNALASKMLAERQHQIERLNTLEDVGRRKAYLRERMVERLGGFPQRTPLNPRVVGVLERDGYRIEKIILESQPRFYATANLYLPTTGSPPYPAILFPLGHERGAKANPTWQQMLGTLARKGFVALTWDPVGQGERVQFYDQDLEDSKVGNSTTEHTVVGTQCMLIGDAVARYTIWDGIRALDYLLSRKEVDPTRIGCTGNSGGGTHTAYLAALDDRIQVAAPSCYITSWRLLLETIGPQDGEQVFPFWLEDRFDFPDYLYAFAPQPYLVLSAIRDFFPIAGARESFQEAKQVYSAIGAKEKLSMFEADDGHGYTKLRRMAAYRWFSRWLKRVEDNEPEPEIAMASSEELRCTPSGQVATSLGGESVFTLNQKRFEQIKARREIPRADLLPRIRAMCRFEPPRGPVQVKSYGTLPRAGYHVEKLVYDSEPGIVVPALLYIPDSGSPRKPALLYADGKGKAASAPQVEEFVKSGFAVLTIDARGFGETQVSTEVNSREFARYFGDYDSAMTALLIGKTLVGMRAQDIARGIDLVSTRHEIDPDRIWGFGKGTAAVPMLYAAALDQRLRKVALEDVLVSYESVVNNRIHRQVFEAIVPGALRFYDLLDLVAAIAPRDVWIVNAVDPLGYPLASPEVKRQYAHVVEAYKLAGAEDHIHIRDRRPEEAAAKVYQDLVQEQ